MIPPPSSTRKSFDSSGWPNLGNALRAAGGRTSSLSVWQWRLASWKALLIAWTVVWSLSHVPLEGVGGQHINAKGIKDVKGRDIHGERPWRLSKRKSAQTGHSIDATHFVSHTYLARVALGLVSEERTSRAKGGTRAQG